MKLLIITSQIPFPLCSGGKIAQYGVIDYLRKYLDIHLVLPYNSTEQYDHICKLERIFPEIKITSILIGSVPSKSLRILISSLLTKIRNFYNPNKKRNNFNKLMGYLISHIKFDFLYPENAVNIIAQLFERESFDIVQFEFVETLNLLYLVPKNIPKVFIHHEIRFKRIERELAAMSLDRYYSNYLYRNTLLTEKFYLDQFQSIITFSKTDKEILAKTLSNDIKIYVSPFPILKSNIKKIEKANLEPKRLIIMGGDINYPNKDAVIWYAENLSNIIYDKFKFKLHIVGKWSQESIRELSKYNSLRFEGFVYDLNPLLKNSILIVPLRIGSGIRAKILIAMAHGVPVISSEIGCEGLPVDHNVHLKIAQKPVDYIDGIDFYKNNLEGTYNIVTKAQSLIKEKYSQETIGKQRLSIYEELRKTDNMAQ